MTTPPARTRRTLTTAVALLATAAAPVLSLLPADAATTAAKASSAPGAPVLDDALADAVTIGDPVRALSDLDVRGTHVTAAGYAGLPLPVQRPHPPIMIGGGKRRVLSLAGREADIVGILTTSVASGTLAADPAERLAESVAQKVEWVRQGAGDRFDDLELSLVPIIMVTDQRRRRTEQYIHEHGWQGITVEQVWEMPAVFVGSVDQIVEDMQARRERYGFSYFVVSDHDMAAVAPIVAQLAGT